MPDEGRPYVRWIRVCDELFRRGKRYSSHELQGTELDQILSTGPSSDPAPLAPSLDARSANAAAADRRNPIGRAATRSNGILTRAARELP
jgi:hypothetical protein